ncbi:MAG: chaperone modulator CbpM [Acidobacteria bacterium]|nr:chaperone modulator CbpM [Acidobacteriota bacterium]
MTVRHYDIVLLRSEPQKLTLDSLASRAGMHPTLVERFVEMGLIEPIEWEGARLFFDSSAIARLRMIKRLRESLGVNLAGIGVILDLLDRLCAVQLENEALRGRL